MKWPELMRKLGLAGVHVHDLRPSPTSTAAPAERSLLLCCCCESR